MLIVELFLLLSCFDVICSGFGYLRMSFHFILESLHLYIYFLCNVGILVKEWSLHVVLAMGFN